MKNRIQAFFSSPQYILVICLLGLVSNCLSAELVVYTLYALAVCMICLWGRDLLPIAPILVCFYMATSIQNDPSQNLVSIYSTPSPLIYMGILLALMLGFITWRLITDKNFGGKLFLAKKRPLMWGMLLLGLAYILGGVGSAAYPQVGIKNILFGLVQFAVIAGPYWVFSGAVDWSRCRKDYFAWIGFGAGLMLLGQLGYIYLTQNVIVEGQILRHRILAGWGIYNNMGCMLAMMIPFAFYLASRYRRGWIGTVVGSAFLIGVYLTCSRSSIIFATAIWLVCIGLMLFSASNRRGNRIALYVTVGITLTLILLFHQELGRLFSVIFQREHGFLDPNSRDDIYNRGMKLFYQYPLLGSTFYPQVYLWDFSQLDSFSAIFPPRWHNTIVQLLVSTGIIGLAAYGFHRFTTVRMFVVNRTREKAFIACSLAVLLGCSLLDCHLFNIGPALFYSTGLAFAENCVRKAKKKEELTHA